MNKIISLSQHKESVLAVREGDTWQNRLKRINTFNASTTNRIENDPNDPICNAILRACYFDAFLEAAATIGPRNETAIDFLFSLIKVKPQTSRKPFLGQMVNWLKSVHNPTLYFNIVKRHVEVFFEEEESVFPPICTHAPNPDCKERVAALIGFRIMNNWKQRNHFLSPELLALMPTDIECSLNKMKNPNAAPISEYTYKKLQLRDSDGQLPAKGQKQTFTDKFGKWMLPIGVQWTYEEIMALTAFETQIQKARTLLQFLNVIGRIPDKAHQTLKQFIESLPGTEIKGTPEHRACYNLAYGLYSRASELGVILLHMDPPNIELAKP